MRDLVAVYVEPVVVVAAVLGLPGLDEDAIGIRKHCPRSRPALFREVTEHRRLPGKQHATFGATLEQRRQLVHEVTHDDLRWILATDFDRRVEIGDSLLL